VPPSSTVPRHCLSAPLSVRESTAHAFNDASRPLAHSARLKPNSRARQCVVREQGEPVQNECAILQIHVEGGCIPPLMMCLFSAEAQ
jgi:hypothetical protein